MTSQLSPSSPADAPAADHSTALALRAISKHFQGVTALHEVDLDLAPGRIHALVGENGAGKSTLINIACGLLSPDHGQIRLGGQPTILRNTHHAAELGIQVVHQEADLFPELSLAETMLLGEGLRRNRLGLIDWRAVRREADARLAALSQRFDVRIPAGAIRIGHRVLAQIATAVATRPRVLFLDEPTASLTRSETEQLFRHLRSLRESGVAIAYVSHRLEEVLALCDEVTILRDGRHIATGPITEFDIDRMVSLMVGRPPQAQFTRAPGPAGELALEVQNLTSPDDHFRDVSITLRRGLVLGLYGLVGAGRSELARAIFGLDPARGCVNIAGRPLSLGDTRAAMRAGLAYLPEDRLNEGIFATHSCRSNVTAAVLPRLTRWGMIRPALERQSTRRVIDRFRVKLAHPGQAINTLSGGNQQKLVMGRWLETQPEVFILDEPTRGVDVGAKVEIHQAIDSLAADGKAILLISSELPEIMHLSDEVGVMNNGRLAGFFDPRTASEDEIAAAAIQRGPANAPDAPPDQPENAETAASVTSRLMRLRELGILAAMVALILIMSALKPTEFATLKNLIDVMTAASITAVGAAGMTLVIVAGGIDISIGAMLGLVGAIAGLAALQGVAPLLCLLLALVSGAILGSINSLLSTLGRVHPIIITLAGISILRGIMLQVTGGYEVSPLPEAFRALTDGRLLGAPKVLWYALGVTALNWLLLSRTLLGRRLLAVGNSEKAARQIGLVPWRLRLFSFAALGALVGLAAIMWGGYNGKIQSNTGLGWELIVIAATVIGGCLITGGRGTALGTFLGAVLISLIYNILVILKISAYWQNLFVGLLILLAVLVDIWLPEVARWYERRGRPSPS